MTTDTSWMPAALATEDPPVFAKINLNWIELHRDDASVLFLRPEMLQPSTAVHCWQERIWYRQYGEEYGSSSKNLK